VKEDRSGWVAVSPEFSSKKVENEIVPAKSAYQLFQKGVSDEVKAELAGQKFDVGQFSRRMRDRWNKLPEDQRDYYEGLAREDMMRFNQESHVADVAKMERQRTLQQEREEVVVYDNLDGRKNTRRSLKKQQRKQEKIDRKRAAKVKEKEWASDMEEEDEDDYSEDDDESDSDDSDAPPKKKKKILQPRKESAATIARREKSKEAKVEKEQYIAERQEDLRKDRAEQAQRRLEFLLQQSDIFSHFGSVKEESARYGIKASGAKPTNKEGARRTDDDAVDETDLDAEHTEQKTTYLTAQPSTLGFGTMRAYQVEGLNWMIRLQENGVNGILADEMGLGKTLQSISVLVYMQEYLRVTGPHLIVVPKSTLSNWMNEIERWAPKLKAIKFHGNKEDREALTKTAIEPAQKDDDREWNVCVTTYEVCNIDKNVLNKFAWSYLIIDEAHRLKNETSAFSKTIRSFETRYRLLLTGTPLQNNLHELWALLNFLVPDVFANAEQFDEWFNLDIDDAQEKNKLIMQLHKILRPFMLRRLKADVEKNLPPKHETILFTGMSALQKKLYRDILLRDFDALQGQGSSGSRSALLNIVMQLRKCAGHPYLFPGVEDRTLPPLGDHLVSNCGKMALLDKLLKRLKERGHRVLLFTQMTRILDIMEDYMVMRHYKYCRIDGNTDHGLREEYIDAYNAENSEKFIFLLSTRAGGLGINLQTADVVILYDSDWNPQADLQAQDRAHRIGQKSEVQVFRFVTEHTIEEKVVERAQQKLKLDAMVVQSGRLKEKDKLSRDDLLEAVRFGADKVFKSKDSSITDDDIDMILDAGKRKTQELNEKLQNAEKGDLLDFKLDGGGLSAQTFEGIDYAKAAHVQSELLGIMDIGKRERRTVANYNENQLYQQQVAAMQGAKKKKKKEIKLPKSLRLPRLEEWQMYQRAALHKIQEEEEAAFKSLPEEQQKLANQKTKLLAIDPTEDGEQKSMEHPSEDGEQKNMIQPETPFELPPLISEERRAEKVRLLSEGFSDWTRQHYSAFIRSSAKYGRGEIEKIAIEVGRSVEDVRKYSEAFWDEDIGKARFSKNEYERVVKLIERGERKMEDIKGIVRGTRILVSIFDNPWEELEFTFVNTKDKLFTADEDRHLLCWAHKFGYGQWDAIKMAIRRSPYFRFDYFLRSLPTDQIGKRAEVLMKAAEKEVEQLEKRVREDNASNDMLEEVQIPMFKVLRKRWRMEDREQAKKKRAELENTVEEIEEQMRAIQGRMKMLNEFTRESNSSNGPTSRFPEELLDDLVNLVARSDEMGIVGIANKFLSEHPAACIRRQVVTKIEEIASKEKREEEGDTKATWYIRKQYKNLVDEDTVKFLRHLKDQKLEQLEQEAKEEDLNQNSESGLKGATGPDGTFLAFPDYDGQLEPKPNKKAFTLFCNSIRKEVKSTLPPEKRKKKEIVHGILRQRWLRLTDEEQTYWRRTEGWDEKRCIRDKAIFDKVAAKEGIIEQDTKEGAMLSNEEVTSVLSIPKKRKSKS